MLSCPCIPTLVHPVTFEVSFIGAKKDIKKKNIILETGKPETERAAKVQIKTLKNL